MNKKKLYIVLVLMLTLVLNACSLANPEAGNEILDTDQIVQDRLIGVVVTDEHLNTFAMDDMQEHPIYATVDKHGSDEPYLWDLYFDGVDGYALLNATMKHGDGEEFTMTDGSDFFSDVNTHHIMKDEGEELELKGTIYLQSGVERNDAVYYLNPVYQTEDGEIYVVGGNGLSSNVSGEEGNEMSSSVEGTYNSTLNGVSTHYKGVVEIKFITIAAPTRILFYQMNENHEILDVKEFAPDEVPEELETMEGTEYVLMETEREALNEAKIQRKVCEPDREGQMTVKVYCPSGDGILQQKYVKIVF